MILSPLSPSTSVASRPVLLAIAVTLLPALAVAQETKANAVALPEPVAPLSAPVASPVVKDSGDATAAPLTKVLAPRKGQIILNFQGASLTDVLNYLSEAAGFVIVQEAPVTGTVNVVSRQAISPEEAVDLVNAVLIEKGYIAIRNGRILKIVSRKDAQKRDLPVLTGSDPSKIPRNEEMVTQILPVRYAEAAKLVDNLRPLLAENANITANESSNTILMTDTQANIRRIAQIIQAIDVSFSSKSTIQVYPLRFADAKELATVITQLFATNTTGTQGGRGGGGRGFGGFGFGGRGGPGGPGGGPGGGSQPTGQSEAIQAAKRVVAVADEQSNSVIVAAPEDYLEQITEMINKLDTSIADVTETRIFRLLHADAVELAELVNNLYTDSSTQKSQGQNQGRRGGQGGGGGGFFGGGPFGGGPQPNSSSQPSGRSLLQSRVVAVGDPRTNSLLVTAARDTMMQIAETVGRLDSTDAKKQRVYVHSLEHADADSVASVLRGMLGDQSATSLQSNTSRLTERTSTGAAMDSSSVLNSNGGGGGGGGRGGR